MKKTEQDRLYKKAVDAANELEDCYANEHEQDFAFELLKEKVVDLRDCYNKLSTAGLVANEDCEEDDPKEIMEEFEDYVKDFEAKVIEIDGNPTEDNTWDISGMAETLSVDILSQFGEIFNLEY